MIEAKHKGSRFKIPLKQIRKWQFNTQKGDKMNTIQKSFIIIITTTKLFTK